MKITFFLRCVCLLLTIFVSVQAAADSLTDAKNAESQGRVREAVEHYTVALQSASDGSEQERSLREKIIDLASRLKPPPAVPEEARRYMGRGQAAVELAKTAEDFGRAAAEFQKAVRMAPWLADAYYNLGVVEEKAGRFDDAMRNFKLYLRTSPNASDAEQVRTRLYSLEYKAEQQTRERRAAEQKRQQESVKQQAALQIAGNWEDNNRTTFRISVNGNKFEIQMTSYCAFGNCNQRRYSNRRYAFGTLEESKISGWLVVNGVDAENIDRSTGRPFSCRHPEGVAPVTLTLSPDGRSLKGNAKHGATNPSCIVLDLIVDLTRTN